MKGLGWLYTHVYWLTTGLLEQWRMFGHMFLILQQASLACSHGGGFCTVKGLQWKTIVVCPSHPTPPTSCSATERQVSQEQEKRTIKPQCASAFEVSVYVMLVIVPSAKASKKARVKARKCIGKHGERKAIFTSLSHFFLRTEKWGVPSWFL